MNVGNMSNVLRSGKMRKMVFWVSAGISRTDFPDRRVHNTVATLLNMSFCLLDLSALSAPKMQVIF